MKYIFKVVTYSYLGEFAHSVQTAAENSSSVLHPNETIEDLEDEIKTNDFDRGRIKLMDSIDIPPTPRDSMSIDFDEEEETDVFQEDTTTPEKLRENASRASNSTATSAKSGNIGSFEDQDVPLIYCSRKLVSKFLISDRKGELVPDGKVRVSLKALAMGCLTQAIDMSPKVFLLPLYSDQSVS